MALLKALPDSDGYWVSLDGLFPMLIRRGGRLILSKDQTTENRQWDPTRDVPFIEKVDLPYIFEPLGQHWNYIDYEFYVRSPAR